MKISNASTYPASTPKATPTAKTPAAIFKNSPKAFSGVAADIADAAGTAVKSSESNTTSLASDAVKELKTGYNSVANGISHAATSALHAVENTAKAAVDNTVALADESASGLKSAYKSTAQGIGDAASAVAGYAQAGLSAGTQIINAIV